MSEPEHNPNDDKVKRLRARFLEIVADAAVRGERLDAIARRLGLTAELASGLGDDLYDAAVAQLEIVAKVLERSQGIADRLLALGERAPEGPRFARVDVAAGKPVRYAFTVHNPAKQPATVQARLAPEDPRARLQIGQPTLPGGRDTALEVQLATGAKQAGEVIALVIEVTLAYDGSRARVLPAQELEIWVR